MDVAKECGLSNLQDVWEEQESGRTPRLPAWDSGAAGSDNNWGGNTLEGSHGERWRTVWGMCVETLPYLESLEKHEAWTDFIITFFTLATAFSSQLCSCIRKTSQFLLLGCCNINADRNCFAMWRELTNVGSCPPPLPCFSWVKSNKVNSLPLQQGKITSI